MGQHKGKTGNPNGRPKGSGNKITTTMKNWLAEFMDGNRAQIVEDWAVMEPRDRVLMFERLMKYLIPAQSQAKFDLNTMDEQTLDTIIAHLKNAQS